MDLESTFNDVLSLTREANSAGAGWVSLVLHLEERTGARFNNSGLNRIVRTITQEHPQSAMLNGLRPGDFEAWSLEGFETTKRVVYPPELQRLKCSALNTSHSFHNIQRSNCARWLSAGGFVKQMLDSAP